MFSFEKDSGRTERGLRMLNALKASRERMYVFEFLIRLLKVHIMKLLYGLHQLKKLNRKIIMLLKVTIKFYLFLYLNNRNRSQETSHTPSIQKNGLNSDMYKCITSQPNKRVIE